MKIEKINDNQIRCTLTRDDLNNRQLKLSELAYGTEKAKELFREMMQQAAMAASMGNATVSADLSAYSAAKRITMGSTTEWVTPAGHML